MRGRVVKILPEANGNVRKPIKFSRHTVAVLHHVSNRLEYFPSLVSLIVCSVEHLRACNVPVAEVIRSIALAVLILAAYQSQLALIKELIKSLWHSRHSVAWSRCRSLHSSVSVWHLDESWRQWISLGRFDAAFEVTAFWFMSTRRFQACARAWKFGQKTLTTCMCLWQPAALAQLFGFLFPSLEFEVSNYGAWYQQPRQFQILNLPLATYGSAVCSSWRWAQLRFALTYQSSEAEHLSWQRRSMELWSSFDAFERLKSS